MSIDVNKFRAGTPSVDKVSGFVADNQVGNQAGKQSVATGSGSIDVNKLRTTPKQVSIISGSAMPNKIGG